MQGISAFRPEWMAPSAGCIVVLPFVLDPVRHRRTDQVAIHKTG
ncbi:hypothetical protein Amir_4541 [Actinosynnema mirum DSM 43827]|uniref:Uncharacterized protein n=1 Tax=Actinosynnema mirum (strain ATCC 29888 / DSM 43827 / JCM 3225 / NBRC 14064 / NCIMB 13271 / NRRL B-12336 / IMRU 3971 / 101) TaxID=446462 RepID=C6WLJ0_ACTMD|nr:hypothetical protein Amir_4541 [Actinosynnema mirum DSM 43827]